MREAASDAPAWQCWARKACVRCLLRAEVLSLFWIQREALQQFALLASLSVCCVRTFQWAPPCLFHDPQVDVVVLQLLQPPPPLKCLFPIVESSANGEDERVSTPNFWTSMHGQRREEQMPDLTHFLDSSKPFSSCVGADPPFARALSASAASTAAAIAAPDVTMEPDTR